MAEEQPYEGAPMEPLRGDAILVRGGLMELAGLRESVEAGYREEGYFNLSFFGDNDLSPEEAIEAARQTIPNAVPNKQIRLGSVGKLAEIGRIAQRQGFFPHVEVMFETRPTDNELEEVAATFEEPVANPLRPG